MPEKIAGEKMQNESRNPRGDCRMRGIAQARSIVRSAEEAGTGTFKPVTIRPCGWPRALLLGQIGLIFGVCLS